MREIEKKIIELYNDVMASPDTTSPHHALNIVAGRIGFTLMGVKRILRKFDAYNPHPRKYPNPIKVIKLYNALRAKDKNMRQFEIEFRLSKHFDCTCNYVRRVIRAYKKRQ